MSVLGWCLVICVGGNCELVCDELLVICCRGLSFAIGLCCDVVAGWFLVCVVWGLVLIVLRFGALRWYGRVVTRLVWRFGLAVYGGFSWVCWVACLLILFWWSLLVLLSGLGF